MGKKIEERVALLEYKLKLERKISKKNAESFEVAIEQIVDHVSEQLEGFNKIIENLNIPDIDDEKIGFTQMASVEVEHDEDESED
tara:strand:+ start:190 stop:444 length:255 start_codon:yes stop_codon:yes gene_type:complete